MDLRAPCNLCSSIPRIQPFCSPLTNHSSLKTIISRRKVTSELQSTAGVASWSSDRTQAVPTHKVTVHDRFRGVTHQFVVPEDQYILHTAEDQNIALPFACRHGIAFSIKCGFFYVPVRSENMLF
uniref:2Fe-2S ferredoxin-type domain-containing protein n=1 Tax=Kalanchoe fedtschenkoi TaxID=63787 RepID=A0A7N0UZ29_KALFE